MREKRKYGGIGRRDGFRIHYQTMCRFKSCQVYQSAAVCKKTYRPSFLAFGAYPFLPSCPKATGRCLFFEKHYAIIKKTGQGKELFNGNKKDNSRASHPKRHVPGRSCRKSFCHKASGVALGNRRNNAEHRNAETAFKVV